MSFNNYSGPFSFMSRFEEGKGTNPEELIGAAHAGCYSMFLSALISNEGFSSQKIETTASVTLGNDDKGPIISKILLECSVSCKGLDSKKFNELAQAAKEGCPVSRLYSGGTADIVLNASLE